MEDQTWRVLKVRGLRIIGCGSWNIGPKQTGDAVLVKHQRSFTGAGHKDQQIHKWKTLNPAWLWLPGSSGVL